MKKLFSWMTICFPVAVCALAWLAAFGVSFFMPAPDGRWVGLAQDGGLFLISIAATVWAVWAVRRKEFRLAAGCSGGGCGARLGS
jgi:hypothetical protein